MKKIICPPSLRKGDKIGVVSPAGSVSEEQIQSTLRLIEERGYEPILGKHALGKYYNGYTYSGTEKERIADFNWALGHQDISAIWATRGGYGCQHLLRHLRFSPFRKFPKWYIGYSDNTVIQSYLFKNGYASIHGQTLKTSSFGVSEPSYEGIFDILKGKMPKYSIEPSPLNKSSDFEGVLVGGNLSLVYALLGTSYSFDFKDKVLFIEEIGEKFYALDRMLISLDLAGVFRKIKGLIVGGMTTMGSEENNTEYEASFDSFAYEIVRQRIERYHFPVVYGFPNGHIWDNRPLVVGQKVKVHFGKQVDVSFS